MDQPSHRRSGCLVIAVFALVGMVASVYTYMIVDPLVSIAPPFSPGGNATLEVIFSEQARYIRTGPETPAFHLEVAFWTWGLPVFMVLSGAVGGGLAGYLVDRCLRRAPWRINA